MGWRERIPDPEKFCRTCGVRFWRKRFGGDRLEDLAGFKKREFCSRACANNSARRSIPSLEERFWQKVEKTETCWVWTGARHHGHGQIKSGPRAHYAHRISYELHKGPIPDGMFVDHMCHNRACVNPAHLRLATNKQNLENRAGLDKNNTSGARGVFFCKRTGMWAAKVEHNGNRYWCGRHATLEEAERAAREKRNELFTHNLLDRVNRDAAEEKE